MALNIDTDDNSLDFQLAKGVGEYFLLTDSEMETTIADVKKAISGWKRIAKDIGISKSEQELMASAFNY